MNHLTIVLLIWAAVILYFFGGAMLLLFQFFTGITTRMLTSGLLFLTGGIGLVGYTVYALFATFV